jgi:hypothetical protein
MYNRGSNFYNYLELKKDSKSENVRVPFSEHMDSKFAKNNQYFFHQN